MYGTTECKECGHEFETSLTDGSYDIEGYTKREHYPDQDTCDLCRGEATCSGHIVWLDGELDKYGRTKSEHKECSHEAVLRDTEGNEVYCNQCWSKMCDGDTAEYEEFVYRPGKADADANNYVFMNGSLAERRGK